MTSSKVISSAISIVLFIIHMSKYVSAGTQFASHVSINTPARSFTHGVGNPLPSLSSRRNNLQQSFHKAPVPKQNQGYPRMKPAIPFTNEDIISQHHRYNISSWKLNDYMEVYIPVLPQSPYKVDSPDPEPLWPQDLLLPSLSPPHFAASGNRRSEVLSEIESFDPYLLEGSEAVAAVTKARKHGLLYFHDIPHIESLLANQELRVQNNLKPHRIGSIRITWPYNRP